MPEPSCAIPFVGWEPPTARAARHNWGALGAVVGTGHAAELIHTVETEAAIIRHAFYKRGTTVIRRPGEHPTIFYIVAAPPFGSAGEEPDSGRRLTYLPSSHEEVLRYARSAHVVAIEILPSWRPGGIAPGWPREPLALIAPFYGRLWEMLIAIAERRPGSVVGSALDELLRDVLDFTRIMAPEWLRRLVDDLHRNWQRPPPLADLAERYDKSMQHICRSLKSYAGTTLRRYLMLLRLDHAGGLIWGTDMPLSEVANATGFADQSHLTRAFSAYFAITPLRLRRAAPCLQRERFLVTE
jgi:AraC-like DNA-binding protein